MPVYNWELNGWFSSSTTGGIFVPDEWTTGTYSNSATTQWRVTFTANTIATSNWRWPMVTNQGIVIENNVLQPPARLTDEERNAARRQRDVARTQARDRADELLLSVLSPQQRESYRLTGEFEVIGSHGGRYQVQRGSAGNVVWLHPDGSFGGRLCAHPDMRHGWMPDQDVALAQLLALTTDEAAFVALANVHAGARPPIPVLA